jgi:hypothetical protein
MTALFLAIGAFALHLFRPDANDLTGYAANGDLAGVRRCLRWGVDADEPSRWGWHLENEGQTPLTAASQYGRVEVVRILLQQGADPNLLDGGAQYPHETALSTAARHGQVDVCRVLLAAGVDPNKPTNIRQSGHPAFWTPLDWALQAEQHKVARLLRRHGAVIGRRGSEEAGLNAAAP